MLAMLCANTYNFVLLGSRNEYIDVVRLPGQLERAAGLIINYWVDTFRLVAQRVARRYGAEERLSSRLVRTEGELWIIRTLVASKNKWGHSLVSCAGYTDYAWSWTWWREHVDDDLMWPHRDTSRDYIQTQDQIEHTYAEYNNYYPYTGTAAVEPTFDEVIRRAGTSAGPDYVFNNMGVAASWSGDEFSGVKRFWEEAGVLSSNSNFMTFEEILGYVSGPVSR